MSYLDQEILLSWGNGVDEAGGGDDSALKALRKRNNRCALVKTEHLEGSNCKREERDRDIEIEILPDSENRAIRRDDLQLRHGGGRESEKASGEGRLADDEIRCAVVWDLR